MVSVATMRTLTSTAALLAALALTLTGCSSSEPEADAPSSTPSAAAEDVDLTSEAQAMVGDFVTAAHQDSEGWLFVETTLTDGTDDDAAIAACEALVAAGYEKVNLAEADGTSYVLAGHPAYGSECTVP